MTPRRMELLLLAVVNLLALLLMGLDKRRAVRRDWRVPESALFLFPLLGGGIGGVLGMVLFHHKSAKPLFRYGFPLLAVADLTFVTWRYILP